MSETLPQQTRLLAMYLHLASLSWMVISVAITILIFSALNQNYLSFFPGLIVIPIVGMLLASLLIFLIWRANR